MICRLCSMKLLHLFYTCMKYKTIEEAIAIQNGVPQGLSSAIMTLNMREAEQFLSHAGSDCGIANVNIGTSAAQKSAELLVVKKKPAADGKVAVMPGKPICAGKPIPLITATQLPLAQGIKFDIYSQDAKNRSN